jgi:hypothetical protein
MEEFESGDQLLMYLKDRAPSGRAQLVAIEGHSTCGKSFLARCLASAQGAIRVSTDCYADPGKVAETYTQKLDLDALRGDLSKLCDRFETVFVEGICLRDTLSAIGRSPDTSVYLKRITQAGLWADDPENYAPNGILEPGLSTVDSWSVRYHLDSDPLARADAVLVRREGAA